MLSFNYLLYSAVGILFVLQQTLPPLRITATKTILEKELFVTPWLQLVMTNCGKIVYGRIGGEVPIYRSLSDIVVGALQKAALGV